MNWELSSFRWNLLLKLVDANIYNFQGSLPLSLHFSLLIPTPALFPLSKLGSLCGNFFSIFFFFVILNCPLFILYDQEAFYFFDIYGHISKYRIQRKVEKKNQKISHKREFPAGYSGLDSVLPLQGLGFDPWLGS